MVGENSSSIRTPMMMMMTMRRRSVLYSALLFHLIIAVCYGQNCPMQIWVYDTLERCDNVDPPNAVGTVYADGGCHTIETDEPVGTTDYALFPGSYKASCTSEGKIRFTDSGCMSDTCAVPGGSDGICLRDFQLTGALFSRLDPPEYVVQQEKNADAGGFFTCFKLIGSVDNPVTVTFVIFGNCGTCDPSAPATPSIPAVPTPAPLVPTAPFALPSAPFAWGTRRPSVAPVRQPVSGKPTTKAPTVAPTATPTDTPTFAPVIAGEPTRPPVTPAPVTSAPSKAPVLTTTKPVEGQVGLTTSETISVALDLSPMTALMSEGAKAVFEDAAKKQIAAKSPSVRSVKLVKLNQSLHSKTNHNQGSSGGTIHAGADSSLRVSFDLVLEYLGHDAKALEIFLNAFGTDTARNGLLLQLVQNNTEFAMLRLIEISGGAPSGNGDGSTTSSSHPALLAGGIGAAATILMLLLGVAGCVVRRKRRSLSNHKKRAAYDPMDSGVKTTAPSSSGGDNQKFTNEIVVDTEADDISTLGGSINGGGGVTVGDEPTASVNLDYDFERKQYIVDGETNTAFTSFSAISKTIPNASVFADDDGSFEQQFNDLEDGEKDNDKKKLRPFEVQVPPGMLGMVVDAPNGSMPVVRAIKPESILAGQVQIGDRLIAVDHQDVTRMTAIDVSNMISLRQNKTRTLVFLRVGGSGRGQ
jgi:hypothetical protein